ncbi:Sec-independent protein translocase protein TatB [Sedimentitalea nanhaiensis]|uniref:Sec-independent protein translocase protein TatB n=1 Tax=Sedimentitalea nanhaiensis TaxID=999627 RepID=A0A1I7D059_9RHOB|nr:Sec-independent protein translocase protein TatB [Sedimentitalea nanhaiensis]SFU05088.1 sec-independent protein translocase protein TatB [Sedimentitalea nanhaiensis]
MFDLGWTELLVIGIVALIVVGPKDLPVLFRNVGRFVGKAKGMAREFSSAMHDAAEESGVHDVAKGLKAATNPMASAMDGVKDAARDLTDSINPAKLDPSKYDPDSETGKLAAERAEKTKKIQAATARAAADRLKREAEEAQAKAAAAEAALAQEPESKT